MIKKLKFLGEIKMKYLWAPFLLLALLFASCGEENIGSSSAIETKAMPPKVIIEAIQCKGLMNTGERCKNKALNKSEYCFLHLNAIISKSPELKVEEEEDKTTVNTQCTFLSKDGLQCSIKTSNKSGYCPEHEKQIQKDKNSEQVETKKEVIVTDKNNNIKSDNSLDKVSQKHEGTEYTPRGHEIFTGPRGGRYHYSKNGKKVYEKKH